MGSAQTSPLSDLLFQNIRVPTLLLPDRARHSRPPAPTSDSCLIHTPASLPTALRSPAALPLSSRPTCCRSCPPMAHTGSSPAALQPGDIPHQPTPALTLPQPNSLPAPAPAS